MPAKGRGRTAPYRGRSGASWIWSTPLDAGASEGELRSGYALTPSPSHSKNNLSFLQKGGLRKESSQRTATALFFYLSCGDFQLSLREFHLSLISGEHVATSIPKIPMVGSSPRGRGTREESNRGCLGHRIIPAWAGNTQSSPLSLASLLDHPRVGGEHGDGCVYRLSGAGSSPRGRGTLGDTRLAPGRDRIIPAWAGNTAAFLSAASFSSDHPRVGGEHDLFHFPSLISYGSSPRGRGTPDTLPLCVRPGRIIPAWAGNTTSPAPVSFVVADHPRVGGEHIVSATEYNKPYGSSPRGRGTPRHASTVKV